MRSRSVPKHASCRAKACHSPEYNTRYVFCDRSRAEASVDGEINSFDIDGFVAAVADAD
ncbi:MAG: hypothetical protein JNG88_01500 [Phycisphaerales bacterium]|nr:hypothetical protein [Phycisphaerales bacterium]